MPKLNGIKFEKLKTAIDWSVGQLEKPRNKRVEAVKQYVGKHYAKGGAEHRVPVNLLELATTIYVRALAARAPRVMVTTSSDELRPFAANMQLALNQVPKEIDLAKTLQRVVLEALVGVGVVKVGLNSGGATLQGHDAGAAFVDVVSLDDYFVDMSAKSRDGVQFEGNDYWLDLDAAQAMYDGEATDLEADEHTVNGDRGENRAESVSTDEGAEVYRDKIYLRDVWLPAERVLLTYTVKTGKLVRVLPWDGPEHGPYYTLAYTDVPGNILPLPPALQLLDLHELANHLFRKLSKQAMGKKNVVAFAGGNDEDAERLKTAADGEGITYSGQKPENIVVGGIDQPTLALFLQARDLFSYVGGNLDSLGGLSPATDTGVQDKLLAEAASARTEAMKASTIAFVRKIFKALAWYEWTDPIRKRTIRKPFPGTDMVFTREWSEETREGDFLDYNLDIDPYSMQDDNPSIRLQKIMQIMERFIIPLMPMLEAQGLQIDVKRLIEIVSDLSNVSEAKDLIVFAQPIAGTPVQGGSPNPSMKPAHTTRTYERVNRPGATRAGKDDVLTRMLMGGGVQQSEAAAIGRPVS